MKTTNRKRTKVISMLLTLVMVFGVFASIPFTASAATSGDYEYEVLDDGYVHITKYNGNAASVTIPTEIKGYHVAGIGKKAFINNKSIKSLTIPYGVMYVEEYAFYNCKNLKNISMADSVIAVGTSAFGDTAYYNDDKNWEDNVLYIGKVAVRVDMNAKSVSLKPGTVAIANYAASSCEELTSFIIPDSVITIGSCAGLDCIRLNEVILPYGLQLIGQYAFGYINVEYSYYKTPSGFTVKGAYDTLAEEYADYYNLPFVNLSVAQSITFSKTKFTLGVGEKYTIIKNVTPSSASHCWWSSSNSLVASVDDDGTVTAKKAGTATITLFTASGLFKSATVTVKPAPSSITLNKSSFTLGVGESYDMSKTVNSGAFVNGPSLTWSSSDKNVINVKRISGAKGRVTAVGTGTATVTVKTYNGKTDTCKVTVKKAPSSIKLDRTNFTLGSGESYVLASSVAGDEFLNSHSYSWSSSNKKVVTVEKQSGGKGKVTAVGTGTAIITVKTYNGKTAKATVTVKKAPSKITLNKKSIKLGVGETHELTSTIAKDEFVNNRNITWSSSNKKVVTVKRESNGKAVVTAVGTGTATITVKTYNGKTATCKVTVYKAPSNVYLDKTKINLGVGEKFELSRSVNNGAFVNGPSLTWTSSDKNIMKVKAIPGAKGEVTGASVGTATVTVETYNGKTATCKVTVHKAPSAITLNKSSVSLKIGKTYELTSTIAKGEFLNNRNINWSSSDTKVVTVKRQSNGKATLTAVGKGTATITVKTYNGKTATCKVTVK